MQAVSGGVGGNGQIYTWVADSADFAGAGFPGPGTPLEIAVNDGSREEELGTPGPQGPDGDAGPTGPAGPAGPSGIPTFGRLDTTHSPPVLYHFDGNLTDSSGNGRNLSLANGGRVRYTDIYPGVRGARFDGVTRLGRAHDAALELLGDVTIEMILSVDNPAPGSAYVLFNFDGFTIAEAGNSLYAVVVDANGVSFWWERGSNTQFNWYPTPALFLPPGPNHFAVTRASNVIQFYLNGRPWGDPSPTQLAPTGGSISGLCIGNSDDSVGYFPPGALADFKIVAGALSAAQIKAEYNLSLGQIYGQIP
jgi:hypothetical protein